MTTPLDPEKDTVAFDVEGTLTTGTAWEGMRDALARDGQTQRFNDFQRRQLPRYLLYRLKLTDAQAFKEDWVAGLLQLFAGRTAAELAEIGRQIVETHLWPARREDIVAELLAHQAAGRQIVLVSGQFQPFLDAFAAKVQADLGLGTAGEWQDGRFSGRLVWPFTTGMRKVELLAGDAVVASDGHEGRTGAADDRNVYDLAVPSPVPKALKLRAEIRSDGGNDSSGDIYIRSAAP